MAYAVSQPISRPQKAGSGLRLMQSALLTLLGLSMAVSALGIWLVSGIAGDPGLVLIKMGLSLFLLMGGLGCLSFARS